MTVNKLIYSLIVRTTVIIQQGLDCFCYITRLQLLYYFQFITWRIQCQMKEASYSTKISLCLLNDCTFSGILKFLNRLPTYLLTYLQKPYGICQEVFAERRFSFDC